MGWWRSYIRQNTRPIPVEKAQKWKTILSTVYFFSVWNVFALVFYAVLKDRPEMERSPDETSSQFHARITGTEKAKVFHYKGFALHKEYELMETPKTDVTTSRTDDKVQENGEQNLNTA